MFKILEPQDIEAKTLEHGEDVFHRALADGGDYYHIKCESGDYDIQLTENDNVTKGFLAKAKVKKIYPLYHNYDENDTDSLYLELFDLYRAVCIETADEYTAVLAKIVLKNTDIPIYCLDPRIEMFTGKHEKLHIVDSFPKLPQNTYLTVLEKIGVRTRKFGLYEMTSLLAFHNLFFLQDMLEGRKLKDIKYLEYVVEERSGIASIIMRLSGFKNAFARFGIKAGIRGDVGRYKAEMIQKYFNLDTLGEESTKENTIVVDSVATIVATVMYTLADKSFGSDVIKDELRNEMDEYFEAVFNGKKVLGLLIRGTDYYTTGQVGERIMAGVDDMKPLIDKWLEEENYDYIFLASEDADVCEKMTEIYGKKVRILSQERHRVSDFKNVTLISELEKAEKSGSEYEDTLEDTTINYFYALYMLSRCDSFMCSGQCNGYDMVCRFNENRFDRVYKFAIALDKK